MFNRPEWRLTDAPARKEVNVARARLGSTHSHVHHAGYRLGYLADLGRSAGRLCWKALPLGEEREGFLGMVETFRRGLSFSGRDEKFSTILTML